VIVWRLFPLYLALFFYSAPPVLAQAPKAPQVTTVTVGGVRAVLISPAKPLGSLILLAGGDGRIEVGDDGAITREGNQLVRTRFDYARKGFAVLVPDLGYDLAALVDFMRTLKAPVTVAGTSRGTLRAALGIKKGARPDRLVLTSGFLSDASGDRENVMAILETPQFLPKTLIVHHKNDLCRHTLPAGVPDFMTWAKQTAKLVWLEGGEEVGPSCEAQSFHGFRGIDQKVVDSVTAFAR
jgi:hypothetical protein